MSRDSYRAEDPGKTIEIGRNLGERLAGGELIILSGTLGSGKTVFTKGIATGLDIDEVVTSPSFAIMNLYRGRLHLCHFDFYRIEDRGEMEDLLEEYLYEEDRVVVVEWGEPLMELLSAYIHVHIEIKDEKRLLTVEYVGGSLP
jgi:tRNA threonylcarbamoyladenosine biosynthesis protein TsaE